MRKLLPILLILLVATVAFAQNKSRLIGTVTTGDGAVISGVKVTISSPALISRTMTTTTSDRGMFRFVLLPVGTYNMTFEKEGYKTIEQSGIELGFDTTMSIDKVMEPAEFEEVITITGEAPVVDKTSSAIGDKLDLEFLQNQPNVRNVWSMPNLTAGFTADSAFGGVEDAGQAYNTDGVNVSDPATGTVFSSINMEAVEQVDVAMFGSPAEYGAFTGASLNVITKSGGNDFTGEFNYFMQSTDWVSDNTAEYRDYGISSPTAAKVTDPNFAVGGPIMKDRAWFFANYNYRKNETDHELIDKVITQVEDPKRPFIKLTARWDDRNITYGSWIGYKQNRSHRVAYGSWRTNYEDGLWKQVSHSDTYLLQHSYVLSDNIILEGRFAGFKGGFDLVPRNPGPTLYNYDTGTYGHSLSRTDLYTRNRDNLLLSASYFNDDFHGTHSFKFGFEYESSLSARYYSHELRQYIRNGNWYRWYNYGTYEGGTIIKRFAGYAQDSWSVSERLTFNLGVRLDSTGLSAQDPNAGGLGGDGTFLRFNDPAFRLGFAYDLFGDGKTVLRGFYGRYYEGVVSGNTEPMVTAVPPTMSYRWTSAGWYLYDVSGGSQPGEYEIDPDIQNQYTEGIMLEVERELMPNLAGSVTFVYKWDGGLFGSIYPNVDWTEGTTSVSTANGSYSGTYYYDVTFGTPEYYTNPKKGDPGVLGDLFRHYYAFVFEINKRMSDKWSLKANYTYSHNTGTANNNSYGIIQGFSTYNNPNDWINQDGRIGRDAPHVLKFSGTYIAPFDIFISPAVSFRNGWAWGRIYYPAGQDDSVLIKPIDGSDRYDDQFNIDLRLEKAFVFQNRYRIGVLFDIFNVLNDDAVTGHVTHDIESTRFAEPSSIVNARFYQLGFRFLF